MPVLMSAPTSNMASFAASIAGGGAPTPGANLDPNATRKLVNDIGFGPTPVPYAPSSQTSAPYSNYTPGAAPAAPAANNDPAADYYKQIIAETHRQNELLAAQVAAAPRLIKYDTAGAAAASLGEANAAQTPLYTQKLNDYLAKTNIARAAEQRHAGEAITDAQDALAATTAGNDVTRTRTGEDTATKLADTNLQEANYFDTSGNQADAARTALEAGNANAGLAESGLGGQKLDAQQVAQAADSNQNQHAFEQTKTMANLFQTRTLQDLARSDALAKVNEGKTESRTKLNLQDFLDTSNIDEQQTRSDIETQRQGAVLQDSTTRQKNKANAFVASLVNSGARPQDIALAKQIYG